MTLPTPTTSPTRYWATEPTDRLGAFVKDRRREYVDAVERMGIASVWRRACRLYYGLDGDGGYKNSAAVVFTGKQGQNLELRANFYRVLVRARIVLATGSRPSYTARPRAYDAQATELVQLGNAIFDNYHKAVQPRMTDGMESAINYGEGWVSVRWDADAGEWVPNPLVEQLAQQGMPPIGPDGAPLSPKVKEGDVVVRFHRPDAVIRDLDVENGQHDWVILLEKQNRWDLAARYPEHRDTILKAPTALETNGIGDGRIRARTWWGDSTGAAGSRDQVEVLTFFHRSTRALPEGRMTIVIAGETIADGVNPYGVLPVVPIIPSEQVGVSSGYGEGWDLLALSGVLDSILSQVTTTQENFGQRNVYVQTGNAAGQQAVSKGTRLISLQGGGASVPVIDNNVGDAVAGGVAAMNFVMQLMQQLSSMNDTAMGSGGSSPSGASLAMQMQIATENNAGIVGAYLAAYQGVMTLVLRCVKLFASTERTVHIAGKNQAPKVRRFTAESITALEGIDVELGSSEMRTTQMRHQIMTDLLSAGLLTDPEQALQMFSTGRLEPAFDGPAAREASIERENEMMLEGRPVGVLDGDHHADHIRRHNRLTADPEIRENEQLLELVQQHIYEHALRWANLSTTPDGVALLSATGQGPSPSLQVAPPPGAAPQGPGPGGNAPPPSDQGPTQKPDVSDPTTRPQGPSNGPANMPSLPPDARPIPTNYGT